MMVTAKELRDLIHLYFEDTQREALPGHILRDYESGAADGESQVVHRLKPGYPLNDLRYLFSDFIFFAVPEAARFVLGSYLIAATEVEEIVTDWESPEFFRDRLLYSLAGGCDQSASEKVAEQYALITIRQGQVVKMCVKHVLEKGLVSGSELRYANYAMTLFWASLPDIR